MDKKIALILPYFGKLPNYFQLWLDSAGKNKVDFLVFTDDLSVSCFSIPENVFVFKKDISFVIERIHGILPYSFTLHKAYKICDYRPLFGLIFSEYLKEYDFWGHCDPDIIWGDLSIILDSIDLNNYDRINERGHLCIYRNVERVNTAVLQPCKTMGISSKDVFTHKYCAHFDEAPILDKYLNHAKLRMVSINAYADLSYFHKHFISITKGKPEEEILYFEYRDGNLVGKVLNRTEGTVNSILYAYVHLQKREMIINDSLNREHYYIIPNEFVNSQHYCDEDCFAKEKEEFKEKNNSYGKRCGNN